MTTERPPLKKAISNFSFASLLAINVPNFKHKLIGRSEDVKSLLASIKELGESPEKGFLLVHGPPGMGKTSLVAHVFTEQSIREQLANNYNLNIAIWLNCAKFGDNGGGNNSTFNENEFIEMAANGAQQALIGGEHAPPGSFASLRAIVHFFQRQKRRRVVFIFDNVTSPANRLFEMLSSVQDKFSCLVITDDDPNSFQLSYFREPAYRIRSLSDVVLLSNFFEAQLKTTLGPGIFGEILKNLRGMPLLAKLIVSRLKIDYTNNFRSIIETNVLKLGEKVSVASFVPQFLQKLNEQQIGRFCAFLLFGPDEPLAVVDLALLWAPCTLEMAESQCIEFEKLSFLSRTEQPDPDNYDNKIEKYILHPEIRRMALSIELNFKMRSLLQSTVRLSGASLLLAIKLGFLKQSDCKDFKIDGDKGLLKLVQNALQQNRLLLWETILRDPTVLRFLGERYPEIARNQDRLTTNLLSLTVKYSQQFDDIKFVSDLYRDAIKFTDKKTGRMPIFWAIVMNGSLEVVEFLYQRHPDSVKARDSLYNQTPLSLAVEYGRFEAAKFLIEKFDRALQYEDVADRCPLSVAAQHGRLDIVEFLIKQWPAGAESGMPLRLAAEYGHMATVRFLVDRYRTAVIMTDADGLKPGDRAAVNGYNEIAKYLSKL